MRKLYPVDSLTSRRLALNWRDEVNNEKMVASTALITPKLARENSRHFATLPLVSAARTFRGEISGGVANFWLFSHATSELDKPSTQTGSLKGPVIQLLDRVTVV